MPRTPRLSPELRSRESVKPLELFFDLVFVLAFTQCTQLMADHPTWEGLAQGVLVLAVVWWAWVGYSWLTSVVEPEEGAVRIAIFGAMGALLVMALALPQAFGEWAGIFAVAYGLVRTGQIVLFLIAARDIPDLRKSVLGLAVSTALAIGLIGAASFFDGWVQGALWVLALAIDLGGPAFFGAEGWKLMPAHFAERHALVIILALGEAIVAIGVGADVGLDAGVIAAGVLGIGIACALWWIYFDIVALVTERRLVEAKPGREQNALARDSYSFLHLPMVAGIVLAALGIKKTIGDVDHELKVEGAFALLFGVAIYLLAHVALRLRNAGSLNRERLAVAVVLVALLPLALEVPAWAALLGVNLLLWPMIVMETRFYGDRRYRLRHGLEVEIPSRAGAS
ncbi:MAG: low temperature requirement protein A [Solirubrobacterales bacterium]